MLEVGPWRGRTWLTAALILLALIHRAAGGVVINEIMYHPPRDQDNLQYVELFNSGPAEVDLSNWSFTKGIQFVFPAQTKLAPGALLVVCRSRSDFVERYGSAVPLAGEFKGQLSHGGERLELSDANRQVVDAVKYADQAPWPMAADGNSSSLERICPWASTQDPANWAASKLPAYVAPAGSPGKANHAFATNLPPAIGEVGLSPPAPGPAEPAIVRALVADSNAVKEVTLLFRVATSGRLSEETGLPMKRVSGDEFRGQYEATIPAQSAGCLVRYRLRALDAVGMERVAPGSNELRGAWSYSTFVNTNRAEIPFAFVLHPGGDRSAMNGRGFSRLNLEPTRGQDAFLYMPPGGEEVQTFDFVQAPRREGGFKIHFLGDQTWRGMTSLNIIFESSPRYVLAEPLAYELYRLAGVPAELTEHVRLWSDGRPEGYHLLIEQPNKAFLARHRRDVTGNLYKLIWYGRDIVGKHEKKTNLEGGHEDLLAVIEGLNQARGAAQWTFIEKHFQVDEFINYFAVNMCIQNWDGFFNNYFVYHDPGGSGRWEIYPWDEDKTWGDYDGASASYDWYELPLTFGMNGAQPPRSLRRFGFGGGFAMWWREPGYFSGPLLANPEFRERFLRRLREICLTIFNEATFWPVIDGLEKRLAAEVPIRAQLQREDPAHALQRFRADIQSFRNQVMHRRKFILTELDKAQP